VGIPGVTQKRLLHFFSAFNLVEEIEQGLLTQLSKQAKLWYSRRLNGDQMVKKYGNFDWEHRPYLCYGQKHLNKKT